MSLSEPHIDHDNGPSARNNGIYLCMYQLSHICHTLVPEIRVCSEMIHVFWYIDMITGVVYNCMHSTEQQGQLELLVSVVKIIDEDRYANT